VAGPIERAINLLPQIQTRRHIKIEQVNAGLFLILWGYFKKVVVADNCGLIADEIFGNYMNHHGLDIIIGALAFSFQIYGDFSGYSDIARGISRLMGIELMINFKLPYFASDPRDFWRRWHISLSSWLRDYLYIPLGGNRNGSFKTYRNLFIVMLLGGLWHGAAWNFVIWGAFHGCLLVFLRRFEKEPEEFHRFQKKPFPVTLALKMLLMFSLTVLGWLIFRAVSIHQLMSMLTKVSLSPSVQTLDFASKVFFFSLPLLVMQIFQYLTRDLLILTKISALVRIPAYSFMLVWILVFGAHESVRFIYFQF
jgi:D-alanyl-lipoteichoic acid acyltransferase DltB (MBOAT superfamily)